MKTCIAALALLVFAAQSLGDVVIHLQTKASPATTQPTADESAVSVSAVPGHDFAAKLQIGERTIDVSGSLESLPKGLYRIKIKFADEDRQGSSRGVETVVELKTNDSVEISKMQGTKSTTSTTLTVEPSKT